MKIIIWNSNNISKALGIEETNEIFTIIRDDSDLNGSCEGVFNAFYGKHHTEETKAILSKHQIELCKDEKYRKTRSNPGSKNGMYGSARFGKLNPMYGKKQSQSTKELIRIKMNKRISEGWKSPNKGFPCPEKIKQAISERNSKTISLKHPNGEIISITNISKYAKENNLNAVMLGRVANGIAKNHKGYIKP